MKISVLVQACSLNRNISVQSRTIEPAKGNAFPRPWWEGLGEGGELLRLL